MLFAVQFHRGHNKPCFSQRGLAITNRCIKSSAHAKSGDAAMIAGYTGNSDVLDQAMVRFAFAYADQNEQDYRALIAAAKSGRIQVARA